ncbi:MAG: anthranilate synthase component I [Bacteroidetes bacterium]|nr:anthranilate synthase component I [Bacteroidota bacterium]MCL5026223.1 anthranilate synthase component I [Chloroflexota bacterium]
MYYPDLPTFCRLAVSANLVPVYRELPADLETPVSVYLKLRSDTPSFLLESVEGGEQVGRYSFLGASPSLVMLARGKQASLQQDGTVQDVDLGQGDPLHLIQEVLARYRVAKVPGLPRFFGGAVGYLAYDTVRHFERLPSCEHDELGLPDCTMLFTDTLVIFDHVTHRMKLVANAHVDGDAPSAYAEAVRKIEALAEALAGPLPAEAVVTTSGPTKVGTTAITSNFTKEEFCRKVERCKEYIAAGDAFQIVFSQRLRRKTVASPFSIYRALRMVNPSPYMFFLDFGGYQLIGSSIETLVKLEDDRAETHPIAGTRRRGQTPEEDQALEEELLADPKERAEHIMLVDLGRNDLGRVCQYGTVIPTTLMGIERFSHVMHIVSVVEGKIRPERNAFDLLRAAFPAGTVSGAPKVRAMEIINELEGTRRGPYAGAVGYFSFTGNMDTCIALRTIVMVGDTVYMQAGGGIVADSVPEDEYQESLNKSRALSRAVELAEEMSADAARAIAARR